MSCTTSTFPHEGWTIAIAVDSKKSVAKEWLSGTGTGGEGKSERFACSTVFPDSADALK